MEQEGRNMKLLGSYIECMKKVFNDTVNKNDDPTVVPQEDLLNQKPLVPTKSEQPQLGIFKCLETLRQDWYDPQTYPSDGEPCKEELHLKGLAMEGVGEDQPRPSPYLQNMARVYQEVWVKANFQVKDIESVNDQAQVRSDIINVFMKAEYTRLYSTQ
ncbi:hypothetical protein R1flu_019130 [Riccia fluitans]|uniref:Uncharacterized protein n=1 Tax=Riccia fluitans TaxID=41844 RepID=A0ABD1ZHS8_9MARC